MMIGSCWFLIFPGKILYFYFLFDELIMYTEFMTIATRTPKSTSSVFHGHTITIANKPKPNT